MRIANSILGLAAVALAVTAVPASAAERKGAEIAQPVALKTDIVVEGDTVTLGDLFSGVDSKAATPIARSPKPGEQVRLPADWLARVARAYAIEWTPLSNMQEATLRRAAQHVNGQQIADAIGARIRQRGADATTTVQLDTPAMRLTLPVTAPLEVEIAALRYDAETGRFTANVMAPSAARPYASATVSGRAVKMVEVPVLKRRISRGEIVSKQDVIWATMEGDRLNRNHLLDPNRIVGKSARRGVQPETPLRETDLEAPVLVAKNSLVTLLLETNQMRLTAQGRAMQDGAVNEVIRVMNTKSNTTVTGLVTADGVVSVSPNAEPTQSAQK